MSALGFASRYFPHDQARFPLATLILCALDRPAVQRTRLLALAHREAAERSLIGIPGF